MSYTDELVKLSEMIKKNKKSPLVFILMFVLTWVILTNIQLEYTFKGIKLNIIIAIILSVLELMCWIIWYFNPEKNRTNKKGIAFLICSDEIEKHDVEKESFFKMLKNECNKTFNILVYERDDLKRYIKKYNILEIMEILNLTMLFEIKERKGNVDNDNNYEIEIVSSYVKFPFNCSPAFIPNFNMDFTKSINRHISISHKNSLIDNKNEVGMLELSSLYILSIMQIISPDPENSFELLDRISAILKVTKLDKSEYEYIENQLPYRYLEAYFNTILKLLNTEKYYENTVILERIKHLQEKYFVRLNKLREQRKIEKQRYKIFYENYLLQKAILVYEEFGSNEALKIINQCDFSLPNNNGAYFSKAFLLMMSGRIEESITIYVRVLKRKYLEQSQVEDILEFIDDRQNLNPENIYLKFCYAIINYFRKDRALALKIFDEIEDKDVNISNQIERILNMK